MYELPATALGMDASPEGVIAKYNRNHDSGNGQFSTGSGGATPASAHAAARGLLSPSVQQSMDIHTESRELDGPAVAEAYKRLAAIRTRQGRALENQDVAQVVHDVNHGFETDYDLYFPE